MWKLRDDSSTDPKVGDRTVGGGPREASGQVNPSRQSSVSSPRVQGEVQPPMSRIGETVKFRGEISAEEDMIVEGMVEGSIKIQSHTLVLHSAARVKADIIAREFVLHGELRGTVKARDKITIKETGKLEGDIVTRRLQIDDGGVFIGNSAVHAEGSSIKRPGFAAQRGRPSPQPEKPSAIPAKAPLPTGRSAPAKPPPKPVL